MKKSWAENLKFRSKYLFISVCRGPGPAPALFLCPDPEKLFGPGPGEAMAPANFFGLGPGGAMAPVDFLGPGPGGAMAPGIIKKMGTDNFRANFPPPPSPIVKSQKFQTPKTN